MSNYIYITVSNDGKWLSIDKIGWVKLSSIIWVQPIQYSTGRKYANLHYNNDDGNYWAYEVRPNDAVEWVIDEIMKAIMEATIDYLYKYRGMS